MLNAEEASARLAAFRRADWRIAAAKRAKKAGRRLQPVIDKLLEEFPQTYDAKVRQQYTRELVEVATALDTMSDKDRRNTMTALHPQLGNVLARWWVDAQDQPYVTGWSRRAFRAPRTPSISRRTRAEALRQIVWFIGPYEREATWLAAWAPFIESASGAYSASFAGVYAGPLLAAAIDLGGADGDAVLQTLIDVGNGDHPIGMMGRHVIVALLRASRVEGWEFIERLLLAAQRQEGLRQSILEAVDEGHPSAFSRMLDVVLAHDLLRFAASVRAAGTWLGIATDVQEIPKLTERVGSLRKFRLDAVACRTALTDGDPWDTYVALCAVAMHDVMQALQWAESVLGRTSPDARAAAVRFISATALSSSRARLLEILDDPSLDVAALANSHLTFGPNEEAFPADAFERLERFARRLPHGERAGALVGIETTEPTLSRAGVIAKMLTVRQRRPLSTLIPFVADMDPPTRSRFARAAGEAPRLTGEVRDVLVRMVGDRSGDVRNSAVKAMGRLTIEPAEAPALEALLTRRAGDLRRGVIGLLAGQRADNAVSSAARLWRTGDTAQRDAACELLGALPGTSPAVRALASELVASGSTEQQRELLARVVASDELGARATSQPLLAVEGRTPKRTPHMSRQRRLFDSDAALRTLSAIDDLAESHRDTVVTVSNWQGSTDMLLADVKWLHSPFQMVRRAPDEADAEGQGLILADVFRGWWRSRPSECRSGGTIDSLAALVIAQVSLLRSRQFNAQQEEWWTTIVDSLVGRSAQVRHPWLVLHVLQWMMFEESNTAMIDACLDAYEAALQLIPKALIAATPKPGAAGDWRMVRDWRDTSHGGPWYQLLLGLLMSKPELFSLDHLRRWLGLEHWVDEPVAGAQRRPPPRQLVLAASKQGAATDDDIRDCLLTPQSSVLRDFTRRRRQTLQEEHPRVVELADEMRTRVLEIERTRGELATIASAPASALGSVSGARLAIELLGRMGKTALVRGHARGDHGRAAVYSHLLRVSYPSDDDTAESVREIAKSAKVSDKRLIEFAVFAPQWARLVGETLAWDGFDDAVWWFHAHTKDDQWSVDAEVRESWTALSAERTPLSGIDLLSGAVDHAWFHRAHATLGEQRWSALHAAAKMASGGGGHRRAQLFAEAMLGDITEEALLSRIAATRHQDSVRALGLVPLPADQPDRGDVILRRYLVLREFERGSAKFGNQRQTSERSAVRIGVENLARSAGFVDPQRFIWATEAAEAGELADGPVSVVEGDVTVTLSVDSEGQSELGVVKSGKPLKSVPANLRKVPSIAGLRDRKSALTRQASRVRSSLEASMVREEHFTAEDLALLDRHPVVAPMLRLIVFVDETGVTMRRSGDVFVDTGDAPVTPTGSIRMAHPLDLFRSGQWIAWQERLFSDANRQPFKQVFRELYTVTETERAQGPATHRYQGHQIQPRQALALLGRRGWLTDRESGDVSRVFHQHGFVARIDFLNGFLTPAEVELPTLNCVHFTRQGAYLAEPIDSVPGVVFSEAMRDLDLIVSVAHAGGVDPESTASTVEMRSALVRETVRLAKLDNVRLLDSHVVIDGTLGEYSIHLGSGVVHRRPGGAVCIIPVDSQRRGRIFLPFADDDPKTAEVIAKVLLLARDKQIKDPTILEQLRS